METELRYIPTELRLFGEGNQRKLKGSIPYNKLSHSYGPFRERIMPGAFRRSLDGDIRAFWEIGRAHV